MTPDPGEPNEEDLRSDLIGVEELRRIGWAIGDPLVAVGHPLTCNGGNPDPAGHHDHQVLMVRHPHGLVCPECGRVQKLPAAY